MSNNMNSLSSILGQTLRDVAKSDDLAAEAARTHKVQEMWKKVIEICCSPHAQIFLNHTNAVYIVKEEDKKILIVYVDDSIFAAELDARREMIRLKLLERFDEDVDEFRILISYGDYKKKHPFACTTNKKDDVLKPRTPLSAQEKEDIQKRASSIENDKVRESLVKAIITSLERKSDSEDQKQ